MTSFGVPIVNFEQISHIVLVLSLLTLNKQMQAGIHFSIKLTLQTLEIHREGHCC